MSSSAEPVEARGERDMEKFFEGGVGGNGMVGDDRMHPAGGRNEDGVGTIPDGIIFRASREISDLRLEEGVICVASRWKFPQNFEVLLKF